MTLQIPTLLALLGAALLAVAIFAPKRAPAPAPQLAGASAPAPIVERWDPPLAPAEPQPPAWPRSVDPRAAGCDAAARIDLVAALGDVRTAWADAILRQALEDEPDARVRDALESALRRADVERYFFGTA